MGEGMRSVMPSTVGALSESPANEDGGLMLVGERSELVTAVEWGRGPVGWGRVGELRARGR